MTPVIQPILDFTPLIDEGTLSKDDLTLLQEQVYEVLKLLKSKLGKHLIAQEKSKLEADVAPNQTLLWFCFTATQARKLSSELTPAQKARVILFYFHGEQPLQLLEETGFLGLITQDAVSSWVSNHPKQFHKMGQGHGLYGLKRFFDASLFEQDFMDVMHSEHYCIFYNYEIHDLDRLLLMYLEQIK